MWHPSRAEVDSQRTRQSTETSTYPHRDVGYEQSSQRNRAQDVPKLFITFGHQWHENCYYQVVGVACQDEQNVVDVSRENLQKMSPLSAGRRNWPTAD